MGCCFSGLPLVWARLTVGRSRRSAAVVLSEKPGVAERAPNEVVREVSEVQDGIKSETASKVPSGDGEGPQVRVDTGANEAGPEPPVESQEVIQLRQDVVESPPLNLPEIELGEVEKVTAGEGLVAEDAGSGQHQDDLSKDDHIVTDVNDDHVGTIDHVRTDLENDHIRTIVDDDHDGTMVINDDHDGTDVKDVDVVTIVKDDHVQTDMENDHTQTIVDEGHDVTMVINDDYVETNVKDDDVGTMVMDDHVGTYDKNDQIETNVKNDHVRTVVEDDQAVTLDEGDQVETIVKGDHVGTNVKDDHVGTMVMDDHVGTYDINDQIETNVKNDHVRTVVEDDQAVTLDEGDQAETIVKGDHVGTIVIENHVGTVAKDTPPVLNKDEDKQDVFEDAMAEQVLAEVPAESPLSNYEGLPSEVQFPDAGAAEASVVVRGDEVSQQSETDEASVATFETARSEASTLTSDAVVDLSQDEVYSEESTVTAVETPRATPEAVHGAEGHGEDKGEVAEVGGATGKGNNRKAKKNKVKKVLKQLLHNQGGSSSPSGTGSVSLPARISAAMSPKLARKFHRNTEEPLEQLPESSSKSPVSLRSQGQELEEK